MKKIAAAAVVLAFCLSAGLIGARAQTCQGEEGAVTAVKNDLTDLAGTVQKEDLADFQKLYHQRSFESRLSICLGMVNDVIACLQKASQDPGVSKTALADIRAKQSAYEKLQTALEGESQSLKAVKNARTAKTKISQFTVTT